MSKILVFAGSNSSTSINYKLIKHTATLFTKHTVESVDMANFNLPIYSEDLEKEGFPAILEDFNTKIANADGIVISVNEHNSSVSSFFKNLIDWLSRLNRSFLEDKKVLLLSVSPGKRGGIGAQEIASAVLPRFGADIVATFSLPSFYDNFKEGTGIVTKELNDEYNKAILKFLAKL